MQRAKPLIPLSHDHHHGLVASRRIREGLMHNINPGRIAAYVRDFWAKDLCRHFEEEEKLIFPLLPATDGYIQHALSEHQKLYYYAENLASDDRPDLTDMLHSFAKLLEGHIRFEERILFPHIEHGASPQMLADVGKTLEKEKAVLEWGDMFWKE